MFFSHRAAPPEPVGTGCAGSDRRPPFARAQFPAFLSLPREGFFSCRASRGPGLRARSADQLTSRSGLPRPGRFPPSPRRFSFPRTQQNLCHFVAFVEDQKTRARTNAGQNNGFVAVRRAAVCGASTLSHDPYAPYGPIISDNLRHVKHHGAPLGV